MPKPVSTRFLAQINRVASAWSMILEHKSRPGSGPLEESSAQFPNTRYHGSGGPTTGNEASVLAPTEFNPENGSCGNCLKAKAECDTQMRCSRCVSLRLRCKRENVKQGAKRLPLAAVQILDDWLSSHQNIHIHPLTRKPLWSMRRDSQLSK